MPRSVTAVYASRVEAEAVRARLTTLGLDPAAIRIEPDRGEGGEPGIFDHLTKLLAPEAPASRFRLTAEVDEELAQEAGGIVEAGAPGGRFAPPREITEQTFIFRETAERLVVDKELAVREELVMRRSADEHVEVIHDSVRRTEAEVERFGPDGRVISGK
jgi:hypothetical protein